MASEADRRRLHRHEAIAMVAKCRPVVIAQKAMAQFAIIIISPSNRFHGSDGKD
ncbi:MAG TPA: hypothetical protein VHY35_20580 [Stellaceae bacterium]|nr:hypothetical protein [Stellaceae bacterium]